MDSGPCKEASTGGRIFDLSHAAARAVGSLPVAGRALLHSKLTLAQAAAPASRRSPLSLGKRTGQDTGERSRDLLRVRRVSSGAFRSASVLFRS